MADRDREYTLNDNRVIKWTSTLKHKLKDIPWQTQFGSFCCQKLLAVTYVGLLLDGTTIAAALDDYTMVAYVLLRRYVLLGYSDQPRRPIAADIRRR